VRFRLIFVFAALLGTGRFARSAQPSLPQPEAIVVVIADIHSAYDREAQFVAAIDALKDEYRYVPMAVLINGDSFEFGNVIAQRSHGEIDLAFFAALAKRAPTILNLGNHEPDFFDPVESVAKIRATGVIVISGNARDRRTDEPLAPASTTLHLGAYDIPVVGFMTDKLAQFRAAVRPDLDLSDPVIWARANLAPLLKGGFARIVLSHAGIRADRDIMPLVPADTLFAGAHDHQRFIANRGMRGPLSPANYFHSGSWLEYYSIAKLYSGRAVYWQVDQRAVPATPVDRELAAIIRRVREENYRPEDDVVIGAMPWSSPTSSAGRFFAAAIAAAAGVDLGFIGNTTFGAGLPAGIVTQVDLDSCVRFDGTIYTAKVDGARLRQLLDAANLDEWTSFERRTGEFNFSGGPSPTREPRKIRQGEYYTIATTDWGAKNSDRYFGEPAIEWTEQPTLHLKAIARDAVKQMSNVKPRPAR
jgi:5'-nucleotidase/UDP-sugar diphosphatase